MLVWAYHQKVSRLKNVAEKLKIRYGKNKTISVRVKGRLDPISEIPDVHFVLKFSPFYPVLLQLNGRRTSFICLYFITQKSGAAKASSDFIKAYQY